MEMTAMQMTIAVIAVAMIVAGYFVPKLLENDDWRKKGFDRRKESKKPMPKIKTKDRNESKKTNKTEESETTKQPETVKEKEETIKAKEISEIVEKTPAIQMSIPTKEVIASDKKILKIQEPELREDDEEKEIGIPLSNFTTSKSRNIKNPISINNDDEEEIELRLRPTTNLTERMSNAVSNLKIFDKENEIKKQEIPAKIVPKNRQEALLARLEEEQKKGEQRAISRVEEFGRDTAQAPNLSSQDLLEEKKIQAAELSQKMLRPIAARTQDIKIDAIPSLQSPRNIKINVDKIETRPEIKIYNDDDMDDSPADFTGMGILDETERLKLIEEIDEEIIELKAAEGARLEREANGNIDLINDSNKTYHWTTFMGEDAQNLGSTERSELIRMLRDMHDPKWCLPALVKAFEEEDPEELRPIVLEAIVHSYNSEYLQALYEYVLEEGTDEEKLLAKEAINRIKT